MRATPSVPPPGGNGTTSLTKRRGHACASAGRASRDGASADAAASLAKRRRVSIGFPLPSPRRSEATTGALDRASLYWEERLLRGATPDNPAAAAPRRGARGG